MNTHQVIKKLNSIAKCNWEIRFHNKLVDINFPDSPTPDYEDCRSLKNALMSVLKDMSKKEE